MLKKASYFPQKASYQSFFFLLYSSFFFLLYYKGFDFLYQERYLLKKKKASRLAFGSPAAGGAGLFGVHGPGGVAPGQS